MPAVIEIYALFLVVATMSFVVALVYTSGGASLVRRQSVTLGAIGLGLVAVALLIPILIRGVGNTLWGILLLGINISYFAWLAYRRRTGQMSWGNGRRIGVWDGPVVRTLVVGYAVIVIAATALLVVAGRSGS